MKTAAVSVLVLAYVGWLGWREQQTKRLAGQYFAAYARGQADLCEELYQMKWGGKP